MRDHNRKPHGARSRRPGAAALLAFLGFLVGVAGFWLRGEAAPAPAPAVVAARADLPAAGGAALESRESASALDEVRVRRVPEDRTEVEPERRIPKLRPPALHQPRPAYEWQGMQVDLTTQAYCVAKDNCGLALACIDNACGPCREDSDCAGGESCVLDQCVRTRNVECRSALECDEGELCVLSGYSADVRGNEDMRAYCLALDAPGAPEEEAELGQRPTPELPRSGGPSALSVGQLQQRLLDDPEWGPLDPEAQAVPTETNGFSAEEEIAEPR